MESEVPKPQDTTVVTSSNVACVIPIASPSRIVPPLRVETVGVSTPRDAATGLVVNRKTPLPGSARAPAGILRSPLKTTSALSIPRGYILYKNDALLSSSHALCCALAALDVRNGAHCKNIAIGSLFFMRCLKHVASIDENVRLLGWVVSCVVCRFIQSMPPFLVCFAAAPVACRRAANEGTRTRFCISRACRAIDPTDAPSGKFVCANTLQTCSRFRNRIL